MLQEAAPEGSGKEAETLEGQIKKLEQQRRNLVTLATDPDNGITADEFRQERERLNERIDQAQFALRRLTQQREHAEENIAAALEGLVHLDQAYHDMPLKLRREMVRCVFCRLIVEGGCIVSIEYNRPFAFVARCKIARHSSLSDCLGPPTATLSELLCD